MNPMFLPDVIFEHIFSFLPSEDLWKMFNSWERFTQIIVDSSKLMRKLSLKITCENIKSILPGGELSHIKFRNVVIGPINTSNDLNMQLRAVKRFISKIEILEIVDMTDISHDQFKKFIEKFENLKVLKFNHCKMQMSYNSVTINLQHLKSLSFERSEAVFFKLFKNTKTITKVSVINRNWNWKGFDHDEFNNLAETLPALDHLVFLGEGTGSFFENSRFSFHVRTLETSQITFNWYVGIRSARLNFLKTHIGYLKHLTIHTLPYDFDGGKTLKHIIENMGLESLYYEHTPLILNGQKQAIKECIGNEVQQSAIHEMIRQFPMIDTLTVILNTTDVASCEVENLILNEPLAFFPNIKHLRILDRSLYQKLFGIYLPLFRKMRNLRTLTIESPDKNINVIFNECLRTMGTLREISIDSEEPKFEHRITSINTFVPNLKKLKVAKTFVKQGTQHLRNVRVGAIDKK